MARPAHPQETDQTSKETADSPKRSNRRQIIKTASAGTALGAMAGIIAPAAWRKPVVDAVLLPAHAQTSTPGGGGGARVLTTPCNMVILSGDQTTATVEVQVTGTVTPAAAGVPVDIEIRGTGGANTVLNFTVNTIADGSYDSGARFVLGGGGITAVDADISITGSAAACGQIPTV